MTQAYQAPRCLRVRRLITEVNLHLDSCSTQPPAHAMAQQAEAAAAAGNCTLETLKEELNKADISKVSDKIAIMNQISSKYKLQKVHALLNKIPDYCDKLQTQIKDGEPGTLRPRSVATYLVKFQALLELPCVKGLLQPSPIQQQQLEHYKKVFYDLSAEIAAKEAGARPMRVPGQ